MAWPVTTSLGGCVGMVSLLNWGWSCGSRAWPALGVCVGLGSLGILSGWQGGSRTWPALGGCVVLVICWGWYGGMAWLVTNWLGGWEGLVSLCSNHWGW